LPAHAAGQDHEAAQRAAAAFSLRRQRASRRRAVGADRTCRGRRPSAGSGRGISVAQVKRVRRKVNGVLIFDKPHGFSSNAALQKVRWLLNAEKAGHTGSLDPLATGVLPLCFGEATKFSQYLLDADKAYETVMQLGVTTTTGDAEGEVVERRDVTVGQADIEALLPRFRGEIQKLPSKYSALKKDGQPLYKLARAGEVVEREARSVTITRLELLACEGDKVRLAVGCSKGTYIRTLVEDLG